MKALILVGGFGTRLRPLTFSFPKPIIEFANKPIVAHQIEALAKVGVKEIVLAVGFQPAQMQEPIKKFEEDYGVKITISQETEPLGTGGPIRLAKDILTKDNEENLFFVFNSDVICDFPLQQLIDFHKSHGKEGSIFMTKVEEPSKYGVIIHDQKGKIERFVEKPKEFIGDEINAGLYLFNTSVIERIPMQPTMLEKQVFPQMASEQQLYGLILPGFWMDVGQPQDYLKGTKLILDSMREKNPEELRPDAKNIKGNVLIHPNAKIAENCLIGPNVTIDEDCIIDEGVRLQNVAILKGTHIKSHTWIQDAILGWKCVVGKWKMEHFHNSAGLFSTLQYNVDDSCNECTYDCFFKYNFSTAEQCQLAMNQCEFDQVNFFMVFFCYFSGSTLIFIPLTIFFIYLLFGFISATVEEYIAEGITFISEYLQLSEALAAVTLLALANGAGDVITAIVASGAEGGISYNIGALYGAGFFVCSMVICLTILASTEIIIVDKSTIFRDVGFYILSTVVTFFYAYQGKIYIWSAIFFLVIYLQQNKLILYFDYMMVLVVYIQDRLEQREKDLIEIAQMKAEAEKNSINPSAQSLKNNPLKKLKTFGNNVAKMMNTLVAKKKLLKQATVLTEGEDDEGDDQKWSDMNIFEKIMFPFEFVLQFLRKITMPPVQKSEYDKILCILWPFPGIFFILFGIGQLTLENYLYYALPLSFFLSMFFYYTQKDLEESEVPSYFIIITTLSTCIGLLWTYIACDMLIDLLDTFVVIFKLDQTYVGLTILGVGNALPDALTTVALAKKGYAQMGITGSYAGQLFGLLIGFGLAQLKTTLVDGPQDFSLFEEPVENLLDILVLVFSFVNLIATALYGILKDYHFGKGLAYLVGSLYVSFFVCATCVQGYYLYNGIE
ncbi:hypothetical protein PPERSA_12615 [Pseudocohnilembus persalinus]|uniref:mannose-1-phosphate guanylyltransferase n=1 Tax=Pseudocohnilembus persalinus TaxID=266149 RepID=A0A0V0QCI2_PSEPJ|nr:hypothetical protein PPERSA_12615 [Pseudocohnilembus persalinus]|eukprot:KRW99939.1 hypothetical protein PPERSA_12615 [Pseudocohnilembus persalinus]